MNQSTLGTEPFNNSQLFKNHYLRDRVTELEEWDCDAEAKQALSRLQTLWHAEQSLVDSYEEDELLDSWIDEVVECLGFDTLSETVLPNGKGQTDRLVFRDESVRREAAAQKRDNDQKAAFNRVSAIVEAKQWDKDFTDELQQRRRYTNSSEQIKYYLDYTPDGAEWGILTNGRKWRLHWANSTSASTYYEIDLPELIEHGDLEKFKYFYVFFRSEAFEKTRGSSFLDKVRNQSERAAKKIGETLQNDVFTALRLIGEDVTDRNNLEIDPGDDERLKQIKEESLIVLYRMMFMLYAESRGLIEPSQDAPQKKYREFFSIDELRYEVFTTINDKGSFEYYSTHSTQLWAQLCDLFGIIDRGGDELGIRAYDGELFDTEATELLPRTALSDRTIAKVIYLIGTTSAETNGQVVLADYKDLNTRHLGSIYEGLLEHQFEVTDEPLVAVKEDEEQTWKPADDVDTDAENGDNIVETVAEGELHVVNDDQKRKTEGAYYTPDPIVQYIVRESVGERVESIRENLIEEGYEHGTHEYFEAYYDEITELRIVDPAMGSGHFLTAAIEYLTDQVMTVAREVEAEKHEHTVKRDIAKECIFGVDRNEMAVELAKVSLWLETLAADLPLAFVDHHLRLGDSLLGAQITDALAGTQTTLENNFQETRQNVLSDVMDSMTELLSIDNETLEDIESMKEIHDEIRSDPLYDRLQKIADVRMADQFGSEMPDTAYETLARAVEDPDEWNTSVETTDWFAAAEDRATEELFFHWDIEFLEVFFDENGQQRENPGFDVVIGNPPYAKIPVERSDIINPDVTTDLYAQFIARAQEILRNDGYLSYITPTSWETGPDFTETRTNLLESGHLRHLVNLPYDVFEDAYVDTAIFVWQATENGDENYCEAVDLSGTRQDPMTAIQNPQTNSYAISDWQEIGIVATDNAWISLYNRVGDDLTVGDISESTRGVLVTDESTESTSATTSIYYPESNESFQRFETIAPTMEVDWDLLDEKPPYEYYEGDRVVIRRLVSRDDRLLGTFASEEFVTDKNTYIFKSDSLRDSDEIGQMTLPSQVTDNDHQLVNEKFLLGILNSSFISWWHLNVEMSASKDDFRQVTLTGLRDLPLPQIVEGEDTEHEIIATGSDDETNNTKMGVDSYIGNGDGSIDALVQELDVDQGATPSVRAVIGHIVTTLIQLRTERLNLNLSVADQLGTYQETVSLSEMGFVQRVENVADTQLNETVDDDDLRMVDAHLGSNPDGSVTIRIEIERKSADAGRGEYQSLGEIDALRISYLSDDEKALLEIFLPYAINNSDEVEGFQRTATLTITLLERLEDDQYLTVPAIDEVRDGLDRYKQIQSRAESLDAQIERAELLLDTLIYNLYGLTEEEIQVIEGVI